jgi:serine/threonine protein kinase
MQDDKYESLVKAVLEEYPAHVKELAHAKDALGRQAKDIAGQLHCQRLILQSLYFMGRYEITTLACPHHESSTCIIHLAIDHDQTNGRVALKLMAHRDQFMRERYVREEGMFDVKYVIGILCVYDSDESEEIKAKLTKAGFRSHPYCIVMNAGDRNLSDILQKERIAGLDWEQIRIIALLLMKCLDHMHSKSFIHGDLKPLVCTCRVFM